MGFPTGGQVGFLPPQTRQLLRDDAIALLLDGFPLSVIDKDVLPAVTPAHDVVGGARKLHSHCARHAGKILYDAFKSAINALTVQETDATRIEDRIRLKEMRPFRTDYRAHLAATKSIFNKVVGEPNTGGFELRFAAFLEDADDVQAFAKNYLAIGFKLDYVKTGGDLSNYTPDFIVRTSDKRIWVVETKGRAELDLPQKMGRLKQWCADATDAEDNGQQYNFVFVDQNSFEKHSPKTFAALATTFIEYREAHA